MKDVTVMMFRNAALVKRVFDIGKEEMALKKKVKVLREEDKAGSARGAMGQR